MVGMGEELERFVASLAIPADRKQVVLTELADHLACAREAAVRDGRDPDEAERAALGDLESMRASLERVEPAFQISRRHALARGMVAAALVAVLVDRLGFALLGIPAALGELAIALVCAPPRIFELLRAELRAPRVPGTLVRGVPIGPAHTYAFTVMSGPVMIWIGIIVVRAFVGNTSLDVPWSAFNLLSAAWLVLLVESVRARRAVVASR